MKVAFIVIVMLLISGYKKGPDAGMPPLTFMK
jgi:hypothetical protein